MCLDVWVVFRWSGIAVVFCGLFRDLVQLEVYTSNVGWVSYVAKVVLRGEIL